LNSLIDRLKWEGLPAALKFKKSEIDSACKVETDSH